MASHFSTLGFPVKSQDDFRRTVLQARDSGELVRARQGFYRRWTVGEGIELWVGCHTQAGLGVNPHFSGSGRMRVRLTEIVPSDDFPLDGSIQGWAAPASRDPESGAFPVVVDLPDFDAVRKELHKGAIVMVQIAAFAHELAAFASDEAFSESQGEIKFAPESFVPAGLFSNGDELAKPSATAVFTGHILEINRLTNPETGAPFYHLLVRTLGGTVDVVADPEIVQGEPDVGGVVNGSFWLSGRIVRS